jgi:4-hydroxyphenylacetate 3-monooxygenase
VPRRREAPLTKEDWYAKRTAVETVFNDLNGIVTRVGDETVGEMWSLFDGQDVLNEINPAFSEHIRHHVRYAAIADPFHVSANTDPKGDRSKRPQDQDPDVLLHAVRETDNGIIVRGAKFETAAAYANQAFVKPTIGDWGDAQLSDYALGFVADMAAPGIKHICRSSFGGRGSDADYPLSNRFDEIDTMIIFDDVEIPWEDVFFYQHTAAAAYIRATLHRYSMFPFVQRHLRFADLLVGIAYTNAAQTGVKMHQGVRERLAELACYREGINAHLTAAIEMAEISPGGLMMPNQALLYTGRVLACTQLPAMMHLARDLCGGQLCVTPDAATFAAPEAGEWLDKYLAIGEIDAEDRRRLFAFARDLLNSDSDRHSDREDPMSHTRLRKFNTKAGRSGPGDEGVRRYRRCSCADRAGDGEHRDAAHRGRCTPRGHLQGRRLPDRHPLSRERLSGHGPVAARSAPLLDRDRRRRARPPRMGRRDRSDRRHPAGRLMAVESSLALFVMRET